jgi:hypothetical protein
MHLVYVAEVVVVVLTVAVAIPLVVAMSSIESSALYKLGSRCMRKHACTGLDQCAEHTLLTEARNEHTVYIRMYSF